MLEMREVTVTHFSLQSRQERSEEGTRARDKGARNKVTKSPRKQARRSFREEES